MAVLENLPGLLSTIRTPLHLRRDRIVFTAGADSSVETAMRPRIKRIRPNGRARFVSPMFIHPKPWRRIFAHVWLERIPARLRDLLMTSTRRLDFRRKHSSVPAIPQRL